MNNNQLNLVPQNKFGVYAIVFAVENNRRIYIGSTTTSFRKRLLQHLSSLKKGVHHNFIMQRLWNKYRIFEFEILEICNSLNDVIISEQKFIDKLTSKERINFAPVTHGGMFGRHFSIDVREKISLSLKGKMHDQERREHISMALKGRSLSLEHREKIAETLKKKKFTPEHCANVSKGRKGKGLGFGNNRKPSTWQPNPEHLIKMAEGRARKLAEAKNV